MSPKDYSARLQKVADALNNETGRKILQRSQQRVSQTVAQTYMQRDTIGPRKQGDNGPLRIQTGRLVRSLTGAREGTRGRQEGISDVQPSGNSSIRLTFGSRVPYAATHEYGDTRTVTEGMRAFFWAKHAETQEDRWKAMALSETLTYPERSYLRTALDDNRPTIRRIVEEEVATAIRSANE